MCASPTRAPLEFRSQALQVLDGVYTPYTNPEDAYPSGASWVTAVAEMKEHCDALDQSLLAFCAIQVRVAGEDSITYDDTVQLYNHALGTVIQDLDRACEARDETLGAIATISTCEVNAQLRERDKRSPHIPLQRSP